MKKAAVCFLLLFLGSFQSYGQLFPSVERVDEVVLFNINAIGQHSFSHQNLAYIEQLGHHNQAIVHQDNIGTRGNTAIIYQTGQSNKTDVRQYGHDLHLGLRQQGSQHVAYIRMQNQQSQLGVQQKGNSNNIKISIDTHGEGFFGNILQNGGENRASISAEGYQPIAPKAEIRQLGNGHEAAIDMGSFSPSILILQQGGHGNPGMRVMVTTIP